MIKRIFIILLLVGCKNDPVIKDDANLLESTSSSITLDSSTFRTAENTPPIVGELEGEDEHISLEKFKVWKGKYHFENSIHDGFGRESIVVVNLELIKPDSSTLEFWLADKKLSKYKENNNYFKIQGGVYGGYGVDNDSIFFNYNKVLEGKIDNPPSPVLTLFKYDTKYTILSAFTSPPHNGELEMSIKKIY